MSIDAAKLKEHERLMRQNAAWRTVVDTLLPLDEVSRARILRAACEFFEGEPKPTGSGAPPEKEPTP